MASGGGYGVLVLLVDNNLPACRTGSIHLDGRHLYHPAYSLLAHQGQFSRPLAGEAISLMP